MGNFGIKRSKWWPSILGALLVLSIGALIAGCGGDDSTGSDTTGSDQTSAESTTGGSETTGEESASSAPVTPEVEEVISRALGGTPYEEGILDPISVETFQKMVDFEKEITPEQEELALDCWSQSTCTLGDGEVTLGVADGFGGNTWRKFTKMEAILQAMTEPDIGKFIYLDAEGDLSKMQSNIRSLAAQGAGIIISYDDFGAAAMPAYAAAQRAGSIVSTYSAPLEPDTSAVTFQAANDDCQVGTSLLERAADVLNEKGEIAYFTGPAGNSTAEVWQGCADELMEEKYPEMSVSYRGYTEWTPAGTAKATSALIASGKTVDMILTDYAEPVPEIVDTYEKAGKKTPSIASTSSSNGTLMNWAERQGTPKAYEYSMTGSTNYVSRISITGAMLALNGSEVPAIVEVPLPQVPAEKSMVEPDKPGDYPGPSVLVPESLTEEMLASG